jgi:hypothetical protein
MAWNLDAVRAREAWDYAQAQPSPLAAGARSPARGAGIRVGLPDSGVLNDPALRGAIDVAGAWDAVEDDRDVSTRRRFWSRRRVAVPVHGTGVASVIAGRGPDILGVAPEATIVPVRVGSLPLQIGRSRLTAATNYLRRPKGDQPGVPAWDDCHVLSFSFGGRWFPGLRECLQAAIEEGKIVVAAAGNGGMMPGLEHVVSQPGSYPEVICVAASDAHDRPGAISCYGPEVDIAAPGVKVEAAGYTERPGTGTSFAVAHVSGAAALWLAYHGRDALMERYGRHRLQAVFRHVLLRSAQPWQTAELGTRYGRGILDARALLAQPLPTLAELDPFPRETRRRRLRTLSRLAQLPVAAARPRLRYRIIGGVYDPGARGRARTALQRHVDPFDRNQDGIITMRETAAGLKRLGLNPLNAIPLCLFIGWKSWRGPALTINSDAIQLGQHLGASQVFDIDGDIDRTQLDLLLARDRGEAGLDEHELQLAVNEQILRDRRTGALRGPVSRAVVRGLTRVELPLLRKLVAGRGPNARLSREAIDEFFAGETFHDRIRMRR